MTNNTKRNIIKLFGNYGSSMTNTVSGNLIASVQQLVIIFGCLLVVNICFGQSMPEEFLRNEESMTIRVGMYDNPPLNYHDSDGRPQGIFIDVLEYIADRESLQIKYESSDWPDLLDQLEAGTIDVLPDIAYTTLRDSIFSLNEIPLITSWLEIYSQKGKPVQTITDLKFMRTAALRNSIEQNYLMEYMVRHPELHIETVEFPDINSMQQALINGSIDAFLADRFFRYSKSFDKKKMNGSGSYLPFSLHFAFKKDKRGEYLAHRFDQHIATIKSTPRSVYYKSLDRWLKTYYREFIPLYFRPVIILLAILLVVFMISFLIVRYQVRIKTKSLTLSNQALVIAKEKAEESERLKSAFLQNISHEVRTPMNGILGFIRLLKESDLEKETRDEFIELIDESGERLLKTVNDIIEISKIESGKREVKYSIVNIEEMLDYYVRFFTPQADKKGIGITLKEHLSDEQAVVQTDRTKLDGILMNLVGNAFKFTSQGWIELGSYIEDKEIVIYVKDSGIGIAEEHQRIIFDRFRQAGDSLTRSYEGAGLGLCIVKAHAEDLKGKVWVESEKGAGSTFFLSIPYRPVKQEPVKDRQPHSKGIRILVAEDDETNFTYYKFILMKEGFQVLHAKNGEQAVRFMREDPGIALILMDIKMPVMDGFEATRQIRQFNASVPIIAQTAYSFQLDKKNALDAGCNDYLSKPIENHVLLQLLEKYLVSK